MVGTSKYLNISIVLLSKLLSNIGLLGFGNLWILNKILRNIFCFNRQGKQHVSDLNLAPLESRDFRPPSASVNTETRGASARFQS